jgi:hypothetical protein
VDYKDIAYRLDGLFLHAGQHVGVGVKGHAIFASSVSPLPTLGLVWTGAMWTSWNHAYT